MAERIKHVTDSRKFPSEELLELYQETRHIRSQLSSKLALTDSRRRGYMLFYAQSEITDSSFDMAFHNLGWGVFPKTLPTQTAWKEDPKQERHLLNIAEFQGYEVVILRSQEVGGAEKAAEYSNIPIINAGEGFNGLGSNLLYFPQHPTQAIGDGFTIFDRHGGIDNLSLVITGDIKNNPVANSWLLTFANFPKARIILATHPYPDDLHDEMNKYLEAKKVTIERSTDIKQVLGQADVLCIAHSQNRTRIEIPRVPTIDQTWLRLLPNRATVIHDLIKGMWPEVDAGVMGDPRFVYEDQIRNGVLARTALLKWVTNS